LESRFSIHDNVFEEYDVVMMDDTPKVPEKDTPFVCSWSGGKDSCLALYHAVSNGASPIAVLSMLDETGKRSRSHGLPLTLLKRQAAALDISLETRSVSWAGYEAAFIDAFKMLNDRGATAGVFGDIDIADHRKWEEMVCAQAGMEAFLPLWKRPRIDLLHEFLSLGFDALIVAANEETMGKRFLGKRLCTELVKEFQYMGIDPAGENGEYHTVVLNGPIFQHAVTIKPRDEFFRSGYWFLDLEIKS
jgi:uncharacterized protein (TIGR00290 family)